MSYAELQVTTNFSFLRGASHAEELVAQAKGLGLAAIAVVYRNTLAGVVRAHVAAEDIGLKLIVGARPTSMMPSLLCLPPDRASYGRLSRLISLGQGRAEKGNAICRLRMSRRTRRGRSSSCFPRRTGVGTRWTLRLRPTVMVRRPLITLCCWRLIGVQL